MSQTLKIVALNTFSAALFALLLGFQAGGAAMVRGFLISSIYANVIGTAAYLVLPSVAARLGCRSRTVYWFGIAGTLGVLAIAGGLVAGVVAAALGLFGRGPWWRPLLQGLGIALVLTLGIGGLMTLYETTRSRLDDARERLRLRELETERAHRLATDARLASLESRLHPHFLFNAIAAIAAEVRESPERAERLLLEFAELLRASLDAANHPTVPLADELAIVRAYLAIEHARLGDRLRYEVDVAEEWAGWPVPPLALHTLVQNSVKHVAAARVDGADIRISAERRGDRLAVAVTDDGPGFDLRSAPPGHGLDTLRARLGVVFAGEAALDADGDGGVTLVLPSRSAIAAR
jgi:hypothetical protein